MTEFLFRLAMWAIEVGAFVLLIFVAAPRLGLDPLSTAVGWVAVNAAYRAKDL